LQIYTPYILASIAHVVVYDPIITFGLRLRIVEDVTDVSGGGGSAKIEVVEMHEADRIN